MKVFFPGIESHVNAIAAAISERGMKRLIYIGNQVRDVRSRAKLLTAIRRAPRYNSTASCATLPVMRAMTSAKVVSRFFILMFFYLLAVVQYAHADLTLW